MNKATKKTKKAIPAKKAKKAGVAKAPRKSRTVKKVSKRPKAAKDVAPKAVIDAHFAKKPITDKVEQSLQQNKVHTLGLKLQSVNLVKADDDNDDFFCTKSIDKVVHTKDANGNDITSVVPVCVQWSDGKDHSGDD